MFVLSDSNANRAYGTSRDFQLRACNAASSADACSSVSLQVWMVNGFTKIFPIVGACPRLRKPMSRDLKTKKLVPLLLNWFAQNARDLPWRRTRDPYAIWVSEIMLQQTQVKTVIPFWNRWLRELPTVEAAAKAPSAKIHKLWEGLGYYTRVRNLQKAAQVIVEKHDGKFPENFDDVHALPGIGRYTAGAICSIAFNQPTPILDGNVIRVLTRIFGIAENPKEKQTNARLWQLAEKLVQNSKPHCSHLNQSLMELGALICTPRNPQCLICPVKKLCMAFKNNRVEELPNLGKRAAATARTFFAFVIERDGKFLVRQRPTGVVNAHLWEFPNFEINGLKLSPHEIFQKQFAVETTQLQPLHTIKHSITRYRITLKAFRVQLPKRLKTLDGIWLPRARFNSLAFTAAHKKLASFAKNCILSDR
jgi:A/G-specific adenine glycosylase